MLTEIVAVYEIILLAASKVIYLGSFKCVATRPESGYFIASCLFLQRARRRRVQFRVLHTLRTLYFHYRYRTNSLLVDVRVVHVFFLDHRTGFRSSQTTEHSTSC